MVLSASARMTYARPRKRGHGLRASRSAKRRNSLPRALTLHISTPLFWTRVQISKGSTVRVGRADDCEVRIPLDFRVSRAHGELRFTDDALYFVDVGSRFGT